MIRTEAAQLVAYLNRAGLVGAMEGQAAVWADALEDVSYPTAQEVVRAMAKARTSGQRWVTPGDIAAEVARIRKARTDVMASPQPPESLEGHPGRELAWRREYVRLIGDGLTEAEADAGACERVGTVRPALTTAPRPVQAALDGHKATCRCGCLTRPLTARERAS